jgi:hypothetical protein
MFSVDINVAVLNRSDNILDHSEGVQLAAILQSKAVNGTFVNDVPLNYQFEAFRATRMKNIPKDAEIRYSMYVNQKFRYVENSSEIRLYKDILILVNSHADTKDQHVAGMAYYDYGVATVDFASVAPGLFAKSASSATKGNGGNHEVGHLLGLEDAYKYEDFKLVRDAPNMMGAGNEFNLSDKQMTDIAMNAICEMGRYWIQYNAKSPASRRDYNTSGFGHGGTLYAPNYNLNVDIRIEKAIDEGKANTK